MLAEWMAPAATWIEALGYALLHFVWQGALLALILWTLMRTLAQAGPGLRYAVGMVGMVLMLALPVATFFYLSRTPDAASAGVASVTPGLAVLPALAESALQEVSSRARLESLLPWIVGCWALGVAFLTLRVFVGWRRLRRLSTFGVRPIGAEWQARIRRLCEHLGIGRAVTVLESAHVAVPTVMGFFRPVVLMPSACLLRLSVDQLELLIAHELGHVRRLDYLANLLQVVVETLLFYHPAVRWLSKRVRAEREQCCDDLVVAHCGRAVTYAKALTNLESIRAGLPAPALSAAGGQLAARVERLVLPRSEAGPSGFTQLTVVALIVAVVFATARHTTTPIERVTETLAQEQAAQDAAAIPPIVESGGQSSAPAAAGDRPTLRELRAPVMPPVDSPQIAAPTLAPPVRRSPPPVIERSGPSAAELSALESIAVAGVRRGRSDGIPLREVAINPVDLSRKLSRPALPRGGPVAEERVPPEFPRRARVAGIEGHVTLQFNVNRDGSVTDAEITESSPPRIFDRAALKAINRWRYDPTTVAFGGERVTQRFDFTLGEAAKGKRSSRHDIASCERVTGTRLCRGRGR